MTTCTRAQRLQQQQKKLVLGMAANSCNAAADDAADDRGSGHGDRGRNSNSEEAAVEKKEWGREQLVALEPGHHIGPYRLQVLLSYSAMLSYVLIGLGCPC